MDEKVKEAARKFNLVMAFDEALAVQAGREYVSSVPAKGGFEVYETSAFGMRSLGTVKIDAPSGRTVYHKEGYSVRTWGASPDGMGPGGTSTRMTTNVVMCVKEEDLVE